MSEITKKQENPFIYHPTTHWPLGAVVNLLSRLNPAVMVTAYSLPTGDEIAAMDLRPRKVDRVSFETIDHTALARDRTDCPEVVAHKARQHPRSVSMNMVEFTPGIKLFCDVSLGKAKPYGVKNWRRKITNIFQQLNHSGHKATLQKIANRYYWPSMGADVATYVKECHPC